jgi:hypothetical protein
MIFLSPRRAREDVRTYRLSGAYSHARSYGALIPQSSFHPETWLDREEMGKPNTKTSNLSGRRECWYKETGLARLPGLLLDIVDKWRWHPQCVRSIPSQDPTLFSLPNWKFLLSCLLVTHALYLDISVKSDVGTAGVVWKKTRSCTRFVGYCLSAFRCLSGTFFFSNVKSKFLNSKH